MSETFLGTDSTPIAFLKKDVECPFAAKDPSTGVSRGSEFLAHFAILERLGLITFCVPVRAGDIELGLEPRLGGFNLDFVSADLMSRGVDPSLPLRHTFLGVRKMRAQLRATSMMLAFGSTVWCGLRISYITTALAVTGRLFRLITNGTMFGTN